MTTGTVTSGGRGSWSSGHEPSVAFVQSLDKVPAPVRDGPTWLLYGALGVLGYLLNGMGAVLGPLQRQLHVDRAAVAFYPSLFAIALLVVGLLGDHAAVRLGHRWVLRLALSGLTAGALLLTAPTRPATLVGALLLGMGGALIVQVVPAALNRRQRRAAPAAVAEANAISSFASVLAPAAVATAVAVGAGWQIGYLLPVLPIAIVLVIAVRRSVDRAGNGPTGSGQAGPGLEPGPLPGRWVDVLLAVSVEFCLVFWAADALSEWHAAGPAAAPAVAALFLLGMAVARTVAARLTAGRHPLVVVVAACAAAGLGFTVFWAAASTVIAAIGLFVTGLGVALLYPMTLARAVAAWPQATDRAAARAALASGVAIGAAPLALARLADHVGLRSAYLIVLILLGVLAAHAVTTLARPERFSG